MTETYIELHARSAFSFLQGASLPEELAATAAHLDYPALALLDRDGFYGSPRFHMAAKKVGIRAHIGAEITCTDGSSYPLLVEDRTGYQNLCRLATRMKLRAKKGEGAAAPEEMAEFAKGLICLAPAEQPYLEGSKFLTDRRSELQHLVDFRIQEGGNLRVRRFLIVVEQEMPAHRLNPARQADAEAPAGHVHLVDALVADVAVAVVPEPVPVVVDGAVLTGVAHRRLVRGRAAPQVVVQ